MDIFLLNLFKDHINFPDDHTDICWTYTHEEVRYNTGNNVDDLMNGDGETYSGEDKLGEIVIDNYVLYTLDSGCGYDYQAIFSVDKKVDQDKYWSEN